MGFVLKGGVVSGFKKGKLRVHWKANGVSIWGIYDPKSTINTTTYP